MLMTSADSKPLHCGKTARKHGKTAAGAPRYRCMACGATFTGGVWGKLPEGDRALTRAEIQKRHRERKKQG